MKLSIGIAGACFAAGLFLVPHLAYPGIPVPAVAADGQPIPTLAPMIKRIASSVVSITIRAPVAAANKSGITDPMDDPLLRGLMGIPAVPQQKETFSAGSGVVIDAANGYIVTNYHVIENADQISVTFLDGKQVNGI